MSIALIRLEFTRNFVRPALGSYHDRFIKKLHCIFALRKVETTNHRAFLLAVEVAGSKKLFAVVIGISIVGIYVAIVVVVIIVLTRDVIALLATQPRCRSDPFHKLLRCLEDATFVSILHRQKSNRCFLQSYERRARFRDSYARGWGQKSSPSIHGRWRAARLRPSTTSLYGLDRSDWP